MALCQIGPADVNEQTKTQRIVNRSMWLIGTFRNSIVVIVSGYVSYFYIHSKGLDVTDAASVPELPFKVIGTQDYGRLQTSQTTRFVSKFEYVYEVRQ